MEESVKKEVESLKLMARNWKEGFKTWLTPGEDNSYVYQEFIEEIETILLPYVGRLVETKHLTPAEAKGLVEYYLAQVEDLKAHGG